MVATSGASTKSSPTGSPPSRVHLCSSFTMARKLWFISPSYQTSLFAASAAVSRHSIPRSVASQNFLKSSGLSWAGDSVAAPTSFPQGSTWLKWASVTLRRSWSFFPAGLGEPPACPGLGLLNSSPPSHPCRSGPLSSRYLSSQRDRFFFFFLNLCLSPWWRSLGWWRYSPDGPAPPPPRRLAAWSRSRLPSCS